MTTRLAIACFVVGVVLMIFFDTTITRILGVAGLFGFIAFGVWAIADPDLLVRESGHGRREP
jgi:hypothetical protein